MERRAKDIICRRVHIIYPTRREYAERVKHISAIINDRGNQSNLSFIRGITHNFKL